MKRSLGGPPPAEPASLSDIVGGALMRKFSWSSVFWINVPLLVAAIIGALHLVADSRDPHATRLDPIGAVLSIAAISTLVYAIIQAPERGWTSTSSVVNFAAGTAIATCSPTGRCAATTRCSTCRCSAIAASPSAASRSHTGPSNATGSHPTPPLRSGHVPGPVTDPMPPTNPIVQQSPSVRAR